MKNISDDVALSEVIGFVLLLGLVVAALSLYMMYIVPINGREGEIAQLNHIGEQFTDFKFTLDNIRTSVHVNNVSPVMTSTSFNLGTGGGNTQSGGFFMYMLQPASSSATLSINATGDTFDIDSSTRQYYKTNPSPVVSVINEFPFNITALEYRSNNNYWFQQKYSYQLGGVFLSQDDGITNRISPLISFVNSANNSVVVNVVPVQIVGGGSLSGNGPARVDTRERILPKYNISTDPYISNTWVNISVTSADNATAAMWLNIFKDTAIREQLNSSAYRVPEYPVWNPVSKRSTAYIFINGTNPDSNWKDVSLYVQRSEFYVAFNNIAAEGGTISTPTPTTTTTPTPTPTTTPSTHTIIASAGANGLIIPNGSVIVNHGASQSFNIYPNTGYHIQDVLVDGLSNGTISSYTFTNVVADHTISASFAINTYTITATNDTYGSVTPAGVTTVNYGATPTYTITPNSTYHVQDVLVNGTSVGAVTSYVFPSVKTNQTISASFAKNPSQQIYYQPFATNTGWPYDSWTRSSTVVVLSTTIRNGTSGYSVRDQRVQYFGRIIPTTGYEEIIVRYAWASSGVSATEYSQAQYTVDGTNYVSFAQLTGPQPSLTIVTTSTLPATVANNANFGLRWRVYGNANTDYLYVDDVQVFGTPI
ncbi:MAG: hypothetical protein Q7U51_14595 [Methanoregula sp.]|nr:hypothetical protein [Methanoregula sp.]